MSFETRADSLPWSLFLCFWNIHIYIYFLYWTQTGNSFFPHVTLVRKVKTSNVHTHLDLPKPKDELLWPKSTWNNINHSRVVLFKPSSTELTFSCSSSSLLLFADPELIVTYRGEKRNGMQVKKSHAEESANGLVEEYRKQGLLITLFN